MLKNHKFIPEMTKPDCMFQEKKEEDDLPAL